MKTFDIDRHADELERDGYTILENVLPASEIEATKQAIEETLASEETVGSKYGLQSENLRMAFNAQAKHPHFRGMPLRYPAPAEVARRVLGVDMFCHNVVIRTPLPSGAKDNQKYGGNLHADWADFTVRPFVGGKHFPMAIQSVWAIEEFTRETGGPYIWPGTHRSLEVPPEEPDGLPPGWHIAEAPAGSVVMWDSALWHSGGVNRSDRPRYSLIFYFQRWWIKGFNDSYRYMSPDARATMTAEELRMWGLEAGIPPNTHFRGMSEAQIAALTPEERAVLNIATY
jgi:hypothetical protein